MYVEKEPQNSNFVGINKAADFKGGDAILVCQLISYFSCILVHKKLLMNEQMLAVKKMIQSIINNYRNLFKN